MPFWRHAECMTTLSVYRKKKQSNQPQPENTSTIRPIFKTSKHDIDPMILIIEDDVAVQSALRVLLDIEGFSTKSAYNPQQGIEALEAQTPDLVLLDLNYTAAHLGKKDCHF